jgi:SAM-dependent methyltransferase
MKSTAPSDEAWLAAHVDRYRDPNATVLSGLPGFPSDEIQRNTTGQAGEATLREAFVFYQDCLRGFQQYGEPLSSESRLLDFGVGWGRVIRFFQREFGRKDLFGIDVDPDLIGLCKETFGGENFLTCAPLPPTPFPDRYFRAVVGCSVFSHLSEEACHRWMEEFHRLVEPGGIVALTTRGRFFFDYCEGLADAPDGYGRALSSMFEDFGDARARYDAGQFVHSSKGGVAGGGARSGNFYGETFIPCEYAGKSWAHLFTLVEFLDDAHLGKHPVMFFKRLP